MLCDGTIQPLYLAGNGHPISVGRDSRTTPERTRKLIVDRDRGCRYPGCTVTLHLDIHHLQYWSHGGGTDWGNLIALCSIHHHLLHAGKFVIKGDPTRPDDPDALSFRWTCRDGSVGNEIRVPTPVIPNKTAMEDRRTRGKYRRPLGERINNDWVSFDPPSNLIDRQQRRQPTPSKPPEIIADG